MPQEEDHPNAKRRQRRSRSPSPNRVPADSSTDRSSKSDQSSRRAEEAKALRKWLEECLCREDGWLRIVPDHFQNCVHLFYKFTRGEWAEHYVYVRTATYELFDGFAILLEKLAAVDLGKKRPTPDRPYKAP